MASRLYTLANYLKQKTINYTPPHICPIHITQTYFNFKNTLQEARENKVVRIISNTGNKVSA